MVKEKQTKVGNEKQKLKKPGGFYRYDNGVPKIIHFELIKFLGKNGPINLDNIPVIRVAELYLTRAEARYNQVGKEAAALADVNVIRTRSGLAARPATLTGAALLTEILNQRRLELAFEGHRFFDLKRLGRDITKIPTNIGFTDYRILAPLPVREIQTNPNLKQNFGY